MANDASGLNRIEAVASVVRDAAAGIARGVQRSVDERFMAQAVELARSAAGWTNPNPLVGAVVVKAGRVIGAGCHERFGEAHAERNALAACVAAGEDPAGATVYVTLEPCSHTGHQPPCADALVDAGVSRVVIGSRDPNPLVSGRGVARLRAAGIQVDQDCLRSECDALNPAFFHYITRRRPYVVAKWAMTADGKIATSTGDARWVSGEESRADVHELRHRLASICVGVNTVLADDPLLTCRREGASRQPLRVIVDSNLRIPLESALVRTAREVPVLVAYAADPHGKREALEAAGVALACLPAADGRVDFAALLDYLGEREVDSMLLEGGATLLASAFAEGLVNEAIAYVAPKIVGGSDAKTPVASLGVELMANALPLGAPRVEVLGSDVKLTYCLMQPSHSEGDR
ncbi:MAG: bifunctional diaminohydroxyphosphoribosylaminopyrimidine deaminase/5-amino-6-(5-phosphoribosylamino)uracil reductase RibD [Eggerthellaceae bacterium]|nr:bifunctional diaminohydroxyphosphoribosylaminopyrimidine deaminase/5-amino-6-(5-phosphoribosylamino)uracil reductase RibD [Eggerthellaceae bacterium]